MPTDLLSRRPRGRFCDGPEGHTEFSHLHVFLMPTDLLFRRPRGRFFDGPKGHAEFSHLRV